MFYGNAILCLHHRIIDPSMQKENTHSKARVDDITSSYVPCVQRLSDIATTHPIATQEQQASIKINSTTPTSATNTIDGFSPQVVRDPTKRFEEFRECRLPKGMQHNSKCHVAHMERADETQVVVTRNVEEDVQEVSEMGLAHRWDNFIDDDFYIGKRKVTEAIGDR